MIRITLFRSVSIMICVLLLSSCVQKTESVINPEAGTASNPAPSTGKIEPYVVKGHVLDRQGRPLEGVEVYADNQLAYNSNIMGYTDENGYYEIYLAEFNTSWNIGATLHREFEGFQYQFDLKPTDVKAIIGKTGGIRDIVWDDLNGWVLIYSWEYSYPHDESMPEFSLEDVELTLTPVTPLIDGSSGQTITVPGNNIPDGYGRDDVPIAKYEVSARWMPEGHEPIPMLVSMRNADKYAESVQANFTSHTTYFYRAEIEVKFP